MPLNETTHVSAAFAQFERDVIVERTVAGMAAAPRGRSGARSRRPRTPASASSPSLPSHLVVYRVKDAGRGRVKQRVMSPVECLARLAAMVPPPRYPHGVLAPRHMRDHVAWRHFACRALRARRSVAQNLSENAFRQIPSFVISGGLAPSRPEKTSFFGSP